MKAPLRACTETHGSIISTQTFAVPLKDAETEVEIGQSMVAAYRVDVMAGAVVLNREVTITGRGLFGATFDVVVPAGSLQFSTTLNGVTYQPSTSTFRYRGFGNVRTTLSGAELTFSLEPTRKDLFANLSFGSVKQKILVDPAVVTLLEQCTIAGRDSFRRELVYSGVSQGSISLLYREFSNDMARPAFTQELHYDLKEGDEVGYKGARFKIIKASNTSIEYQVLKPLD